MLTSCLPAEAYNLTPCGTHVRHCPVMIPTKPWLAVENMYIRVPLSTIAWKKLPPMMRLIHEAFCEVLKKD